MGDEGIGPLQMGVVINFSRVVDAYRRTTDVRDTSDRTLVVHTIVSLTMYVVQLRLCPHLLAVSIGDQVIL